MKNITITVPNNCELKQDGNTYTIVEKEKKLTYEDIVKELFYNKKGYYITAIGTIKFGLVSYKDANNCASRRQAEKILALNKLMTIAKYLNGDWQPDWNNTEEFKYYISYSNSYNVLYIDATSSVQDNIVYFKSEELAEKAIEILGEETIKLALCTDY